MFSHLPGRDLLHVKLVSKHFNSLVPVVYSFRGRANLDKVILIQQWWKDLGKKRLDACAEQFDTRKLVVDECLMITETVFGTDFEKGGGGFTFLCQLTSTADSKKRALACREELLAFLHEKEGKEKEIGTKKKGFLFRRKKKEEDVFTVENVETIFHLPLLTSQAECLGELVEGLRQAAKSYSDAAQKTKKQRCCWAVVRFFKKIPAVLEAYMDYLCKANVAALLFDGPLSKKEDYPDFWRIVASHFCFPNGTHTTSLPKILPSYLNRAVGTLSNCDALGYSIGLVL